MGLDMYAYRTIEELPSSVDFDEPETLEDLFYWRKHPDLHGWMRDLYEEKGGQQEFNCVPVELDLEDLDRLEAVVMADALPVTTGFFFGITQPEHKAETLDFIAKARQSIEDGYSVYYSSWW